MFGGSVCYGNLAGSSDPLVSVAFPRTERNDKIFEVPFDAVRNLASDSQWYVVGVTEFSSGIIIFFFNQAILKYIGEYALVSYTIISYVNTIVVMSMAGIAQGSQPLISYYYGKNEPVNIKSF